MIHTAFFTIYYKSEWNREWKGVEKKEGVVVFATAVTALLHKFITRLNIWFISFLISLCNSRGNRNETFFSLGYTCRELSKECSYSLCFLFIVNLIYTAQCGITIIQYNTPEQPTNFFFFYYFFCLSLSSFCLSIFLKYEMKTKYILWRSSVLSDDVIIMMLLVSSKLALALWFFLTWLNDWAVFVTNEYKTWFQQQICMGLLTLPSLIKVWCMILVQKVVWNVHNSNAYSHNLWVYGWT